MTAQHLIRCLTTLALLTPASISVVSVEGAQHGSHAAGPLTAAVRQATERFRDVNEAIAVGYVQFQGCVSGPAEGAMGVHYSNFALFNGQQPDVEHPQALVYEPQQNGRLELVAVEYITPADAWDSTHEAFDKPQLMGQLFHFAPGPNRYGPPAFYELHVWAWKDNPRGAFADWNPTVSSARWEGATL
jgi:hypothetical protein